MSESLQKIEALFAQGQAGEALEQLRGFLENEPDNIRALNDLGTILMAKGERETAEQTFRRALSLEPDRRDVRLNLALSLAAGEKWSETAELVTRLLAENQNEARLWTLLAKVERAQGNLSAALEYLDKSLTLDSEQTELQTVRDKLAAEVNRPAAAKGGSRPSVLMCCQSSMEHFAMQLCDEMEKYAIVKRVVASNFGPLHWPIRSADTVWLEWGSGLAADATRAPGLLSDKKVILRLHSYEILGDEAGKINYDAVTDIVFVCQFMRSLFNRKWPGVLGKCRSHVIHNGIDLDRFPFITGKGHKKIAMVGRMDAKKDPMLMLQAFTFLWHRHPELELHVAGLPDNNRYYLAMPDMIAKNNLDGATHFYGHVNDIPAWLADKDCIICTSPIESQGVGLLEAMHRGLRPLIYNFPGAQDLYPASYLWSNFDELEKLLFEGPAPEECRDFVAARYSMKRQAKNFLKVITGTEEIVEPLPVEPPAAL